MEVRVRHHEHEGEVAPLSDEQVVSTESSAPATTAAPAAPLTAAERVQAMSSEAYWSKDNAQHQEVVARVRASYEAEANTPAALHEPKKSAPEVTDTRRRIQVLNDPKNEKGIFTKDRVAQQAAVAELRKLLAEESSADEKQAVKDSTLADLRNRYGLAAEDRTQVLKPLVDLWSEDAEQSALATLANAGAPAAAVKDVTDWYKGVFNDVLGTIENINPAAIESEFRQRAEKAGLDKKTVDRLVNVEKYRLGLLQ